MRIQIKGTMLKKTWALVVGFLLMAVVEVSGACGGQIDLANVIDWKPTPTSMVGFYVDHDGDGIADKIHYFLLIEHHPVACDDCEGMMKELDDKYVFITKVEQPVKDRYTEEEENKTVLVIENFTMLIDGVSVVMGEITTEEVKLKDNLPPFERYDIGKDCILTYDIPIKE